MAETGKGGKKASGGRGNALDPITVNPELCLSLLQRQWHSLKTDLEDKLFELTGDEKISKNGRQGAYNRTVFQGHCREGGSDGYLPFAAEKESYRRIPEL